MIKLKAIIIFMLICFSQNISAQKTLILTEEDSEFKTATELFQKEKYGAAQKSFSKIVASHTDPKSLVRIDAEYYNAICAVELFNKDGELYLKQFVKDHPDHPKVNTAYFYLGKYNYRKKKYKDVLNWFAKVDIYDLTTDELAELYFTRGYCYFMENKFAEAKKNLFEIKDVDNKYASAAKYYYAHIAYNEKNYETALKDFHTLEKNETFGSVVPYYIAQIYYLEGKYDEVINYVPPLLDSANTKRAPEMARILGESYYRTSKYKEAIPLLKKYEKAANGLQRKDNYQLGYAYYKINEYDNALNYFIKTTDADDSLSQNSFYHIADCYLKTDKKQSALTTFGRAYKMNYDKAIQEDALFNYAKLCYELSYNPYNEAIKAFQKYIKDYPKSSRADEAYSYLANVFITTKSYKDALESLEKISELTPELQQAFQKVAYYRGVDLFNNFQYPEAIKLFDKSMTYTFDKDIRSNAIYWKAESFYRIKQYQKAIDNYTDYVESPGSIGKMEVSDANYNIGYSYYKMSDWTNSILWFRKFVTFKPHAEEKKINDAFNRIGDGYFMKNEFANAEDYYDQAYKTHLVNSDYSLFQMSIAEGVQKRYKEAIANLKLFINNYGTTNSSYVQRAKYELASAYYQNKQSDLALENYKSFIEEYPNSTYQNKCLSNIGLIYYTNKDEDNALLYFDKLIKRDRKSMDAITAIEIVKQIYTSKGNVASLKQYLESVDASMPQATYDSLAYNSGKIHYLKDDYKSASADFAKYIKEYPVGIFILNANFLKAECDYSLGNIDSSLVNYSYIIHQPKGEFTEKSLSRASDITFKKKNYSVALDYYKQLEQVAGNGTNSTAAMIGLMRCNIKLKNYADAIVYANKVMGIEKPGVELLNEAHYTIASSNYATEKYDEALSEFMYVAANAKNEMGAESKYNVAYIQYLKNDYKQSLKTALAIVSGEGDYNYWDTKALILLADNYVALNNNFQAKVTLKEAVSESGIPELTTIAQQKLDKINLAEEEAKRPKTIVEPIKLEFDGNSEEQNKLFIEPVNNNDSIQVVKPK